jgi:hypothetical protein
MASSIRKELLLPIEVTKFAQDIMKALSFIDNIPKLPSAKKSEHVIEWIKMVQNVAKGSGHNIVLTSYPVVEYPVKIKKSGLS